MLKSNYMFFFAPTSVREELAGPHNDSQQILVKSVHSAQFAFVCMRGLKKLY